MLRDQHFGGRLHVVICIRDLVLASVFRSEHGTRYREEPHISILRWNSDSIEYFLEQKLRSLPNNLLQNKNLPTKVQQWLGIDFIENKVRNIKEPIVQYLLRHTRMQPRDIVTLGNRLSRAMKQEMARTGKVDPNEFVPIVVEATSRIFGNEQLQICANHISSNEMPSRASQNNYSSLYTGNEEHNLEIADQLKNSIREIGKDRLNKEDFKRFQEVLTKEFNENNDVLSALWENGLIGYVDTRANKPRCIFYSEDAMDDFNLPLGKDEYVFHSCVIDAVGIKGIGKPVVGFTEKYQ